MGDRCTENVADDHVSFEGNPPPYSAEIVEAADLPAKLDPRSPIGRASRVTVAQSNLVGRCPQGMLLQGAIKRISQAPGEEVEAKIEPRRSRTQPRVQYDDQHRARELQPAPVRWFREGLPRSRARTLAGSLNWLSRWDEGNGFLVRAWSLR